MSHWASDWSRHYDDIQWKAVTMFTAAEVLILAYAIKDFDPMRQQNQVYLLGFIGIFINLLIAYYSASFREKRRHIHESILDSHERVFIKDKKHGLPQWPVYLSFYWSLTVIWIYLCQQAGLEDFWVICAVVGSTGIWFYLGYRGRNV